MMDYQYTGAPVVGTPILGNHYIVSCDAEVCGAERESSRTIQGRINLAVYFDLLCFASGATLGENFNVVMLDASLSQPHGCCRVVQSSINVCTTYALCVLVSYVYLKLPTAVNFEMNERKRKKMH